MHLQDALESGSEICFVCTVDTDVVIILIGKFHISLLIIPLQTSGLPLALARASCTCTSMPSAMHWAKTSLHPFPCFTVLQGVTQPQLSMEGEEISIGSMEFLPRGYTSIYRNCMAANLHNPLSQDSQQLEHFIVSIYDETSTRESINEARREFFCKKSRTMENIPPTQVALLQHSTRTAYQNGIWTTCELVGRVN